MKAKVTIQAEVKYLKVDAGVRYWEDSIINGVEDIDFMKTDGVGEPLMPCAVKVKNAPEMHICSDHYRWQPIIELATGKIMNWEIGNTADVHYKVCDAGKYHLLDEESRAIISVSSYVPGILCPKDDGFGDYIIMDIDADGIIKNWECDEDDLESLIEHHFALELR